MFRKDRIRKKGGGLLVYVADRVKASRILDLEDDYVESLWLSVHPHNSNRAILIGAFYRPPSTSKEIDSMIELNIETAYLRNCETILVGDINVDYLDKNLYSKHRLVKSLKSMNMTQHVSAVTRPKSNSCLDHVYSTHGDFISDVSVPNIGIADHLPVFFRRKYNSKQSINSQNNQIYLDFKNLNKEALLNDLRNSPWDSALVFDDVDDTLDAFELLLNQALKEHIPFKQKRVRKLKQPDWINDRIISAIKTRDKELKKARKSNDPAVWAKYRRAKCFVTNLIRKSKRIYFQESIEKTKGILKEFGKR